MQEIKSCTDQLASLGRPLDPEDIIDKILDQLNDPDYDSVIFVVQNRETPISLDELHEKLINKELSLKHKANSTLLFPLPFTMQRKTTTETPNQNSLLIMSAFFPLPPNPTTFLDHPTTTKASVNGAVP